MSIGDYENYPKEGHTVGSHIAGLEEKNRVLKSEIRRMQKDAERQNLKLRSSEFLVRCTGCIPGGPNNYENLTEEKVQMVENIAERLRAWWLNSEKRTNTGHPNEE
ncbi:hypothetical protein KAR91_35615 [Candidatus Pacearchaeota archaeon]|nr:hypothetical protein [Candidatus Pacearchaeota archaeon]